MNLVYPACLLGGILVTLAGFAFHAYACRYLDRHLRKALTPPSLTDVTNVRILPARTENVQ